jgi:predicted Rossmann fold nucleotide-binding protein DprA/Smf involved in DNA uptake
VYVGRRLGLYQELAAGPATVDRLAERTGTTPRYVREWLLNQVASGYVEQHSFPLALVAGLAAGLAVGALVP